MSIIIKRNTGWQGSASKIHISINGEKVAHVSEGDYVEVELPNLNNGAELRVTQGRVKSNKIEVKDGDVIEIKSTRWYRVNLLILVISMFLVNLFIEDSSLRIIVVVTLGLLMIGSFFIVNGFHVNIAEEREKYEGN